MLGDYLVYYVDMTTNKVHLDMTTNQVQMLGESSVLSRYDL